MDIRRKKASHAIAVILSVAVPALGSVPSSKAAPAPRARAATWESQCDSALEIQIDGEAIARAAGLHYVAPGGPGITRRGSAEPGFTYFDASGKQLDDPEVLQRIEALAIPPNYHEVWISPDPESHIQATALDARGREQYRYHPKWIAAKAEVKFSRMLRFGNALPAMHTAEEEDLRLPGLAREKMLAALTRLLEESYIRVGNVRYATANESYGLTTLLSEQVSVQGAKIRFRFKGKSGVFHDIDVHDPELAAITRQSLRLHQEHAFEYVDSEGVAHSIDSQAVNGYIQKISAGHFTAKDFRTWGGTTLAAKSLLESPVPKNSVEAQASIDQAIRYAAEKLGNTPTVCKSNYIDPRLLTAYLDGRFRTVAQKIDANSVNSDLKPEERLVLQLLANADRRGI